MEKLPDNWAELSSLEKEKFFAKYYIDYTREGETDGLFDWAPDDIKEAYAQFRKETEDAGSEKN